MEITNDDEYFAALSKLVRAAEYIEQCGKNRIDERALMRYDEICEVIQSYRRGSNESR